MPEVSMTNDSTSALIRAQFPDPFAYAAERTHQRSVAIELGPRNVGFERRDDGAVVVHRDPSKPGQWRATLLDANREFVGHIESQTFAGAIRHAFDSGAKFETMRDVFANGRGAA
jgi:hypothetical protein